MPVLRSNDLGGEVHERAHRGRRHPLLARAAVHALVAWSVLFGAISLLLTVLVVVTYLRGPTNSGDVPETLPDAIWLSVVFALYANALALPFTGPLAVVAGSATAWSTSRRARSRSPSVRGR